ncbi:probable proline--tRNA ligase, mitochondrial [Contarinia nasturtii]|uniref:probable proline--tRNA ligase, mitochondrial n=1 Tax=Contarinia nasturtii TaxID=265458 RepID=UPI0012D483CD|nr:probable proline--tRNA ligase, mitochondrial [Contarinia nasturtii]
MHRVSKIFHPADSMLQKTKNTFGSKNQSLLIDYGLMKPLDKGTYYYLPILQRSINKTSALIKRFMHKIDAQEITIPNLTATEFWKKSGRYDDYQSELFQLKDRNDKMLLLGPTFEEVITHMMKFGQNIGEKQMPIRLYQIGNKFRDENARYGLLRCREFLMKDLYTFDMDKESSTQTYEEVNEIYDKFFKFLGIPFKKVEADAQQMGGNLSHEYHYLTPIGEQKLQECSVCNETSVNSTETGDSECPKCKSNRVEKCSGIEVGHTFLLGDTYTKRQKAHYLKGNKPVPMQMGCYGIGVTRLIGAAIEKLSTDSHLRWPFPIAPFSVCIVPPEKRSKAFNAASHYLDEIHNQLNSIPTLHDSILVDDRIRVTVGDRFRDARRLGIPLVVIIGKKASEPENPQFELHFIQEEKECYLSFNDLIAEITKYTQEKLKED